MHIEASITILPQREIIILVFIISFIFCFVGFFQNYKKTNVFMNFIAIKPEYEALFLVAALI